MVALALAALRTSKELHVRCRHRVAHQGPGLVHRTALAGSLLAGLFGILLPTGRALAQQVKVIAPAAVGMPVMPGRQNPDDDGGAPVEMFENANLDRYLRRAETFLERSDFAAAIQVLQDVAEGRTPVEVGVGEPAATEPDAAAPPAARPRNTLGQDERYAVFASDGRLYRPVRRLGQEMLAHMPHSGIELYCTLYDADAERMLIAAIEDGSMHALQAVIDRYYVSLPAGRAMALLADRCMHEGRYRAGVQVLRDLLDTYPRVNRRKLGLDETWLHFKIALCLAFAGEKGAAHDAAVDLAATRKDDSLRILGELQSVKDLPEHASFQVGSGPERRTDVDAQVSWLRDDTEQLVPLWQYRFVDPDPYREPKSTRGNEGNVPFDDVVQSTAMPLAGRYYPGTNVQFADLGLQGGIAPFAAPRVLFLEHYRLRVADALTGVLLQEGDGVVEPSAPRANHPRIRIAASDYSLLRAIEDDDFVYAVLGFPRKSTGSTQVFRASDLVAYDRQSLQRVWSSGDWLDGDSGLRDVTFLAAPTVFGERLFLPSLRRDTYALECLDRQTGKPLWATPLQSGGTPFFKAPGARVHVEGGTAYLVTNSGCLGAIDAFTGDLRWIRRYERSDPLRPTRTKVSAREHDPRMVVYGRNFVQAPLPGFFPSDMLVRNGLLCIAPVDSDVLLCVDGATGQPVWMLDASSRYVTFGRLRVLVGTIEDNLYACSDTHLVCISLRGGLVRWAQELPTGGDQKTTGRGRGTIIGDHVVLPGNRELLVIDAAGKEPMRRLQLPSFGSGREPLEGSFHVCSHGPWLAVGYAGGVELLTSSAALLELGKNAPDPLVRASCLLRAGRRLDAEQVLRGLVDDANAEPAVRSRAGAKLLASVRHRALLTAERDVPAGLTILDEFMPPATHNGLRLDWYLARLDCCKAGGDLRRFESEQQALYDFMEGKR